MSARQVLAKLGVTRALVTVVIVMHVLAIGLEISNLRSCHGSAPECWAYFYVFILDLPISILLSAALSPLTNSLSVNHFWGSAALALSAFFIVGTIWWVFLIASVKALWRLVVGRRSNA